MLHQDTTGISCCSSQNFIQYTGNAQGLYLVLKLKKEAFETSDSDITRVKILMEDGEIYLDTDIWVLKSWDLLRKLKFVLGF